MEIIIFYLSTILCTVIGMKYLIKFLKNRKVSNKKETSDIIKKPCIKELHKNKLNTLTMGGVVMNIVLLVMSIGYYLLNNEILWFNIFIILFGVMGFIDDYIKMKKIRDGVTAKEKLVGLIIISTVFVLFLVSNNQINTELIIPFMNKSIKLNMIMYSIFLVAILVATTNSINITDGLDGLVLGISIIVLTFIAIAAWQTEEMGVLYSILIVQASCVGTLVFNRHPAKIFIGDTGSLFLGGAIAIFMIKLNIPLWIVIVLIVCLWETITVIIQLTSLRFTGNKVFKIAPYHHHLEKCGWKETKIVYVFWLITFIFCVIGYMGMNI